MSASGTPASARAARAPSRSASVMDWLNRETMRANRYPAAEGGAAGGVAESVWRTALFSLELRFALLEEGAGALAHVVGRRDQPEQRGFEELRSRKRHLQDLVHGVD